MSKIFIDKKTRLNRFGRNQYNLTSPVNGAVPQRKRTDWLGSEELIRVKILTENQIWDFHAGLLQWFKPQMLFSLFELDTLTSNHISSLHFYP